MKKVVSSQQSIVPHYQLLATNYLGLINYVKRVFKPLLRPS